LCEIQFDVYPTEFTMREIQFLAMYMLRLAEQRKVYLLVYRLDN
jgi:hypothetical protein